jgi:hypothetical protein
MTSDSTAERFAFAFDRRLARPLSLLGVRPGTCRLLLASPWLEVRFGPWTVRTTLDNVADAEITGPFSVWKVIGARVSMADRGLTFGTNTEQGVCIRFRQPVRGFEPTGLLRHPGLTVTVADPSTVAGRLRNLSAAR